MTIIRPNNQRIASTWRLIISLAGTVLVASVIFCGCVYSKTVGLKHDIMSLEDSIKIEQMNNAELKNTLFKMTDPQMLEIIATEKGLVLDKNPQWVFASLP
ncbi:MAG: hypothetical protein WC519_02370 [Parcubacteria group bacterium]